MIETIKSTGKNNFQTLTWSLNRNLYIYRLQLNSSRETYLPPDLIPLKLQVITSLIECNSCVIDVTAGYDESFYQLYIICSSEYSPEVFSNKLNKIIPGLVIEELKGANAVSILEKQMLNNNFQKNGFVLEIKESKNFLVNLLLEYKALIFTIMENQNKNFTKGIFLVPFVFFYYKKMLCGIPEASVEKLVKSENDLSMKLKYNRDLALQGIKVELIRDINVASIEVVKKKEPGIFQVLSSDMDFNIIIPAFLGDSL